MADHLDPTRTGDSPDHAVTLSPRETSDTMGHAESAASERYSLGEEIARGVMGVVFRATDTAFGRNWSAAMAGERRTTPGASAWKTKTTSTADRGELPPLKPLEPLRW